MKAILYIIAIIAIAAGAWFSVDSMGKFKELQSGRKNLDTENEVRKSNIKETSEDAVAAEAQRDSANKALVELESARDNVKSNLGLAKRQVGEWDDKVKGQQEQLDKVQNLTVQIKKQFSEQVGGEVELDQIPGLVQKLEDELKQANKDLEEVETNVATATGRVKSGQEQIADLNQRMSKRANNIKSNSVEGEITAVNHDWGFVTVRVPSNMPVTTASKLLIKRGRSYIGNIKINAIEGTRIVADIDYKSMTSGMVVQTGDHVVLSKPVTN